MPEQNREKIKHDLNTNIFVEAGAGSGKTTVLTDRMVNMVKAGFPIEKICAITFTKAAANEFYDRFQKKLSEAGCTEALKNIDHCFMGTIDAFCNMILSEHPDEAGIPANSTTVMADDLDRLYRQIFTEYRRAGGDEKLKRFLHYNYNAEDIFSEGMLKLSDLRNTNIHVPVIEGNLEDYLDKSSLVEIVKSLVDNKHCVKEKCEKQIQYIEDNIDYLDSNWDENFDDVARILKQLKTIELDQKTNPEEQILNLEKLFVQNETKTGKLTYWKIDREGLLPQINAKIDSFKLSTALDYISSKLDETCERLKNQGYLSFFDYQVYLRDMLKNDIAKNNGKLIDYIYDRHSYFLIDEFQDTNPIQAEIFFYLASKEKNVDWTKCIPKPGSLFIVGDPKQSIYRFRNADVASYLNVAKLFESPAVGELLPLVKNFRSTDTMCKVFNEQFTTLLPTDDENQRAFPKIPMKDKESDAKIVGAYHYNIEYKSQAYRSDDAPTVANIIRSLDVDYKDIMVIVRKKSHLKYFMKAFKDQNIPFDLRGYVMTDACPALSAIAKIYSAIARPDDDLAMYAATRTSGIDITEQQIRDFNKNMTPTATFEAILNDFKIFAHTGADYAEYVYFALELLRESGANSLKEAADYITQLANHETGEEQCPQLTEGSNRVLLANLHKVKGLEAPVVILADPYDIDEKNARPDKRSCKGESYIFNVSGLQTLEMMEEQEKESQAAKAESIRLLYVAATRAGEALIICNNDNVNPWNPLLEAIPTKEFIIDADPQTLDRTTVNTKELYKDKITVDSKLTYKIKKPSDEERVDVYAPGKDNAALKGTLVHKMMEELVSSNFNFYTKNDVVNPVAETILNGGFDQVTGAPKDIKAELLDAETYCEVPFCYKEGNTIVNGIIDLIYKKDGMWHIIDYKTDTDKSAKHEGQLNEYVKAFKTMTGLDADAKIYHITVQ